ncbi:NUMOD1 domain-containing DNA-binding protein [Bacillus benzoevorans]|uniref:Nuclease-associated modular DNA-binding 1 domain-containing protein n=1 Tax=Bacillus benzoevorans TaxID=1456 RepID=A0A7X0HUD2_9BACI|nr:NUMOD1 domain-containing DNA-binding protein [Bacillus benzoevorans]MBB6447037.1 hypothetical protein [Bacillus benzoevorans]
MALVTDHGLMNWTESNKEHFESIGYRFTDLGDYFEVAKQHLTSNQSTFPKLYPTKWIGRKEYNSYYIEKGYTFTKANDEFLVSPSDLLPNSKVEILCICDACNKIFRCKYYLHYDKRIKGKPEVCDKCRPTKEVNFIDFLNNLKKAYDEGMFKIEADSIKAKDKTGYVLKPPNKKNQIYLPLHHKSRISKEILLFVSRLENKVNEKTLASYWFQQKLPNVKMDGFWTKSQCIACFSLIKEKETLTTSVIRKKYQDLYAAITNIMPFNKFLTFCGEDLKDYYNLEDRRILGIYVEHCIIRMIKEHSDYFDFQQKDQNNRLDIVCKIDKKVIEIKLSIHTRLYKEIKKYQDYDLEVVFLLGEEGYNKITSEGFKKLSIFQWVDQNEKFLINKELLLRKVREFKSILQDPVILLKESQNYYTNLCIKVFNLRKSGESHEAISKKVDLSRRQIGRILNNQTLKPYIDIDLSHEYEDTKILRKEIKDERDKLIIELSKRGLKVIKIQKHISELYGSLSTARIEQIIRKSKVKKGKNKGKIIATDLDGNILGTFSSSVEAARELNISSYRNICTALRNEIPHYKKIKFYYA